MTRAALFKNMYCKKIILQNYRNIGEAAIDFSPGINVLVGNNAQGKTNVLEAIYTFARGKSFRGASDREIATIGKNEYFSLLHYEAGGRQQQLSIRYYEGEKLRQHNGIKIDRLADMIGLFRAVFFCPEHLDLIKGGAGERRALLNIALSQSLPGYLKWLGNYNTILANRNALLRDERLLCQNKSQIEAWSLTLADYAAELYMARRAYVARLEFYMNHFISDMTAGAETVKLRYRCDIQNEGAEKEEAKQAYRALLLGNLEREKAAGATLYGVHRDDIVIKLNGLAARDFTSQGQQRSLALAIKLSEGEISKELVGEYPVFLFDDVLSELDESRRKYVLRALCDRQILITSCEKEFFSDTQDIRMINVQNGTYSVL